MARRLLTIAIEADETTCGRCPHLHRGNPEHDMWRECTFPLHAGWTSYPVRLEEENQPSTGARRPECLAAEASSLRVVAAAIRAEDGTIYHVPAPGRHHHVIGVMTKRGCGRADVNVDNQGFLLSDGNFARRNAAEAVARKAGQLIGPLLGSKLTSEDLW